MSALCIEEPNERINSTSIKLVLTVPEIFLPKFLTLFQNCYSKDFFSCGAGLKIWLRTEASSIDFLGTFSFLHLNFLIFKPPEDSRFVHCFLV